MVQVRKKDGSLEDFNREKVYNSLLAAGLSPVDADEVADEIQVWVAGSDQIISTLEIRERSIDLMKTKDVTAAERYKAYKKLAEEEA